MEPSTLTSGTKTSSRTLPWSSSHDPIVECPKVQSTVRYWGKHLRIPPIGLNGNSNQLSWSLCMLCWLKLKEKYKGPKYHATTKAHRDRICEKVVQKVDYVRNILDIRRPKTFTALILNRSPIHADPTNLHNNICGRVHLA